jgi:hypothetical protein
MRTGRRGSAERIGAASSRAFDAHPPRADVSATARSTIASIADGSTALAANVDRSSSASRSDSGFGPKRSPASV